MLRVPVVRAPVLQQGNVKRHMRDKHSRLPDSDEEWSLGDEGRLRISAHRALRAEEMATEKLRAAKRIQSNRRRKETPNVSDESTDENSGATLLSELTTSRIGYHEAPQYSPLPYRTKGDDEGDKGGEKEGTRVGTKGPQDKETPDEAAKAPPAESQATLTAPSAAGPPALNDPNVDGERSLPQVERLPPIDELHDFINSLRMKIRWKEAEIGDACARHYGLRDDFLRFQLFNNVNTLVYGMRATAMEAIGHAAAHGGVPNWALLAALASL